MEELLTEEPVVEVSEGTLRGIIVATGEAHEGEEDSREQPGEFLRS